jgi:hypothetical protein
MAILFFLLGLVSFLGGGGMLVGARSWIHEVEGFILLLISTVFWSVAGVVEMLDRLRRELAAGREHGRPDAASERGSVTPGD